MPQPQADTQRAAHSLRENVPRASNRKSATIPLQCEPSANSISPPIIKMFYKNYILVSMETIKELPSHDMGIIKKTWRSKMRLQKGPKR